MGIDLCLALKRCVSQDRIDVSSTSPLFTRGFTTLISGYQDTIIPLENSNASYCQEAPVVVMVLVSCVLFAYASPKVHGRKVKENIEI
jgi:hypothetical protein